jgi:hypothetical protein
MKFKIQAGAEFDVLTQSELRETLDGWYVEISRGIKFRKFSAQGNVSAGAWAIGGQAADNDKDPLGPAPGFVWAITRVAISGNGVVPGTDLYAVYVDEVTPTKLVTSGLTRGQIYDVGVLVLNGGERLALAGVGTGGTGTDVTLSGQAVELPVQLAWQLL